MATETKKVVTLDVLGAAINKIKTDYPTTDQVTQMLENAGTAGLEYATEDEVLALFADTQNGGETGNENA